MKIAVFLPNWIGDAVMATPTLRAIRSHYSGAEIVAVLRPYVADVLDGLDVFDRMIFHEPKRGHSERRGWSFVRKLRNERFDIALLLPNSLRSAWNSWVSGARRRVGFDRDARGWLLTDRIKPRSKKVPHPVIDEYLRLAAHLGCHLPPAGSPKHRKMELATTDSDEQALQDFWKKHPAELEQAGVICLNPGGAFGSSKHWPAESFGKLANRLATQSNKTIVVLCGPDERAEAQQIVQLADHSHVVSLGEVAPSIGLTKAAIRHSEMLVTTDSGPRHFATPFSVPVVTLFGPTHICWSETFDPQAVHLQIDVDCGPCQKRVCAFQHHRCMRDLSCERVFAAAMSLWKRTRKNRSAA